MKYFDAIDTCEAVAHEMASTHLVNGGEVAPPSWRGLRFRKAIGADDTVGSKWDNRPSLDNWNRKNFSDFSRFSKYPPKGK